MADVTCPLCNGPTEEHEAYRDRACPKCGLSAPPDVLERIRGLTYLANDLKSCQRVGTELCREQGRHLERIAALEAELAQLKQPASARS